MRIGIIQNIIDGIRGKDENVFYESTTPKNLVYNSEKFLGSNEDCVCDNSLFYEIYKNHKGYISMKWEQYLHIYNKVFAPFVLANKPVSLIEIGVQNGGSLEIWSKFLPDDSKITGIDIDERCKSLKFDKNINVLIGDASSDAFIDKNLGDAKFDIIIDDGSHICSDVINTFKSLFPKLNYGGIYLIEDAHTSYWDKFEGGLRKKQSYIEYFKNLIDSLNYLYIHEKEHNLVKDEIAYLKELHTQIASISFYDSVIVIEKYAKKKDKPFRNYITEGIGEIVPKESCLGCSVLCDEESKFEKFYR